MKYLLVGLMLLSSLNTFANDCTISGIDGLPKKTQRIIAQKYNVVSNYVDGQYFTRTSIRCQGSKSCTSSIAIINKDDLSMVDSSSVEVTRGFLGLFSNVAKQSLKHAALGLESCL